MTSLRSRIDALWQLLKPKPISPEEKKRRQEWTIHTEITRCAIQLSDTSCSSRPDFQRGILIGGEFDSLPLFCLYASFHDEPPLQVGLRRMRDYKSGDPGRVSTAMLGSWPAPLTPEINKTVRETIAAVFKACQQSGESYAGVLTAAMLSAVEAASDDMSPATL